MNETRDRCGPAVRAAQPPVAQAPPPSAPAPLARSIRRSAAILLTPAGAIPGELTTGLYGTAPAVGFPARLPGNPGGNRPQRPHKPTAVPPPSARAGPQRP